MLPTETLARLEALKRSSFGAPAELERLLAGLPALRFGDSRDLIRLHEALLFVRAYPASAEVARLADAVLAEFSARVADVDPAPFREPEVSGIAGTSFAAYFSYPAARSIASRHGASLSINHDAWDTANLGSVLRRIVPLIEEDWPVEAHVPYRDWMNAARGEHESEAAWLTRRIAELPDSEQSKAEMFESLRVPIEWELGSTARTRTLLRLPVSELFVHREPLIGRATVSIESALALADFPIEPVPLEEARRLAEVFVDTSAMRYRELYGFNHPAPETMLRASLGRGVECYLFGVPPEWRLPLRAYHAGMYFKNGVPMGYVEVLSLFERAEIGFNLYYTFREGESAWLYSSLLKLLYQVLGVSCFSVDPYQIGDENPEAIRAGAFWFYRKLGFRPLDARVKRVLAGEERRMREEPAHRSSQAALRRMAKGYILWDGRGDAPGEWDGFRVRSIGLEAARRGLAPERGLGVLGKLLAGADLARFEEAKRGPDEIAYLRLLQSDAGLRRQVIALGS